MKPEPVVTLSRYVYGLASRQAVTIKSHLRRNVIGLLVVLFATTIFFYPVLIRAGSYNPGGDGMFNAWTLARGQNCILRQNCPNLADGNIFFPHKSSMVFSESQLSAALLTLPLRVLNNNPTFIYNMWTFISFLLGGWFMYLLAKHLSRGNEFISVLSALLFEFGPYKLQSFVHIQNLSIFYLPLIVLLILRYIEKPSRKLLVGLFITLVLQFYASWYQMSYVLLALVILLPAAWLLKLMQPKKVLAVACITALAVISTLPLAYQYSKFSQATDSSFGIDGQAQFSASLMDYVIPQQGTLAGGLFHKLIPNVPLNSYNSDSSAYHGLVLYVAAAAVLIILLRQRKKNTAAKKLYRSAIIFYLIGFAGFITSLGPMLKLRSTYLYPATIAGEASNLVIPLPYMIVTLIAPGLSFMRAIGRATVLVQFSLCCIIALIPLVFTMTQWSKSTRNKIMVAVCAVIIFELFPFRLIPMSQNAEHYNLTIPAAYSYIRSHKDIDNIVVLAADSDYYGNYAEDVPVRDTVYEQVLWAGYDNKNTFNGYSGYFPPGYGDQMDDFIDFSVDDIEKMQALGLRYILVDMGRSMSRPDLVERIQKAGTKEVYKDQRFALYKL